MVLVRSITLAVLLMIFLAAIGLSQEKGEKKPAAKSKTEKKAMTESAGKGNKTAVVETSMGTFEMELYTEDAPKTTENFIKLTEKKYFDGMRVHRVARGFVIQTGDDKSKNPKLVAEWGTGGQSIWGKEFEDELNPNTPSYKEGYKKGVVAMANRGPNTNTSQFFVCLGDVPLPHSYTIFGKVTKGMDVVEKIGQVAIAQGQTDGRPISDVLIKKISLKK